MRKGKEPRPLLLIVSTTLLALCPLLVWPIAGTAATPHQVLVVANRNEPDGLRLAEYYMSKRRIPLRNIVRIRTTLLEDISRQSYEKEIAAPIRYFLSRNDPYGVRFKYLLLLYGIPLRIEPPPLSIGEWLEVLGLGGRLLELRKELKFTDKDRTDAVKKLQKKITDIEREIYRRKKSGQGAAVDSELALVRDAKHPLEGRLPNPYFLPFRNKNISRMSEKVITVSRLDGPSAAVVRRVIDDSLAVEKKGLSGKAYFDARWPRIDEKNLTPYQRYDRAIRNTANLVEKSGRLKVILDEREPLFQPGQAPDASLYCGWYSLGKYVDAFTWKRGAVGYHVASAECTTLKQVESRVWCKSMLEKGVAATLGPVDEPYLDAFPAPEIFFGCLLNGGSLADCYTLSNPFWSWQMILLGDPLYRPFKARRPAAPILFRPAPGH